MSTTPTTESQSNAAVACPVCLGFCGDAGATCEERFAGGAATYGIIDPDYARIFTIARVLAWSEGYALTMHGSFTRDLDLVAVPWTDKAREPEHLARRVIEACGLKDTAGNPGIKPHGRKVWTMRLPDFGDPRFVDFSVVEPTTSPTKEGAIGADASVSTESWYRDFVVPIAELVNCLPSHWPSGNAHIIRTIEDLAKRPAHIVDAARKEVQQYAHCKDDWGTERFHPSNQCRVCQWMNDGDGPVYYVRHEDYLAAFSHALLMPLAEATDAVAEAAARAFCDRTTVPYDELGPQGQAACKDDMRAVLKASWNAIRGSNG
jgi:hypothetical protein